jgi:hypothetical protein
MRYNKSNLAFGVFLAAGIAGLASDFGLGAWRGWKNAHTLSHFFFGLGFPFPWMVIFSANRKANRKIWQVALDDKARHYLGDGFWLGVLITEGWSLWNEIIVYRVRNPAHPSDWHHWLADLAGIAMAYAVFQIIKRFSAITSPQSR